MSDPNNATEQPRRLTIEDPVSMDQLNRLRLLQESHADIADRMLSLETEKVKLLAAARRIAEEKQRVFEGILLERGLAPDATVEIEATSGKLKVLSESSEPAVRPAPPQPSPS